MKRAAFWVTVAGVALIAPFALNLLADKVPSVGLRRFRDYITNSRGA